MTREAGTLEQLAHVLGEVLRSLEARLAPAAIESLFTDLGVKLPDGFLAQGSLPATIAATSGASVLLDTPLGSLNVGLSSNNTAQILSAGAAVLSQIAAILTNVGQIGSSLNTVAATFPGLTPAQRTRIQTLAAEFPARLVQQLAVDWIERKLPDVVQPLALTGIIDNSIDPGDPADPLAPPHRRRGLHLDLLATLISNPAGYLQAAFGLGRPDFTGVELFQRIKAFLADSDLPAVVITPPGKPAIFDAYLFRLAVDTAQAPPGLTFRLRVPAIRDFSKTTSLKPPWSAAVETTGRFQGGLEGTISAKTGVSLRPPAGAASLAAHVTVTGDWGPDGLTLLGQTGASRLSIERFSVRAGLDTTWNGTALEGTPAAGFSLDGGKAVIDTSKGDSFLSFLTGGVKGEASFSLTATWSATGGLKFGGSSGLEIAIPTHAGVGPARITTFYLRAGVDGDGSIPVELSAAIAATLGPLAVSVDGVGLIVRLGFPKSGGNLGPLNVGFEFKAPTGVGLSVDGGGFKGGGFLRLDTAKGQYAGALELEFAGFVSIKAIGILDTKRPPGSFSLLIIITSEFIPIQLGFGFTLVGVGGLLGLNRTVHYDPLRAGVHDGSLNSILFPADVVANAPRIINDLERIFPPMEDRFLIGPMAKFGWGTPTILSLELGLILEIPRPAFAILGVLRASLPAEDLPLLRLQVNFLGIVDFGNGQLSFDASLVDSRLLAFTLSGDMALRLYWGDNANFLLSVGGFHPAYTPPPMGLGPMQRLSIEMFGGMPRIRAETYFAVTSNTVQFGAKLEMYAGADIFNVYGFLALDVLIQFNPFYFIAQFSAMLAVRSGSATLFGVRIEGLLEGPTPMHASGTGSFEIGFIITISISVHFDVTFGDNQTTTLPPVDVLPQLVEALGKKGNWRAIVPDGSNLSVTLRELPAANDALILHPFGTLEISQKLVPLNLPISRFGSQKPTGGTRFSISQVSLSGDVVPAEATKEQFAPGHFLDMSDADKLSRRSFERYDAGVRVGSGERPNADYFSALDVAYEVIYLPERRKGLLFLVSKFLFDGLAKGNAAAQSTLSFERRSPSALGTPRVAVESEKFAVATTKDLTLHADALVFDSEGEAHAAMQEAVNRSPDLVPELQVVPLYQVNRP